MKSPRLPLTPARAHGLLELRDAQHAAGEMGYEPREFACPLRSLQMSGVTETTLRWLLRRGFIEHRIETAHSGKRRPHLGRNRAVSRRVRKTKSVRFMDASCFVLTDSGNSLVERIASGPRPVNQAFHIAHANGTPRVGTPHFGTPHFGTPHFGTPHFGTPHFGTPHFGTPHFGTPHFALSESE
ncbi:MAG: hypothetical protein HY040_00520 [Planctomycetes bacterium]|nr:hypothetical protein [Planctomycetota bacterium]